MTNREPWRVSTKNGLDSIKRQGLACVGGVQSTWTIRGSCMDGPNCSLIDQPFVKMEQV